MNPCIVFDIETAPDPNIWDDLEFVGQIKSGLSAPSNYKDEAKIAAYIEAAFDREKDKASLSWCHGKIRAIGWKMLGSEDVATPIASEDELEVLDEFSSALFSLDEAPLVGGFNIRAFDVPFVSMRCAVHHVELPTWWPGIRDWHRIIDPVDIFGRQTGRLSDYLRALSLPGKSADGRDAPGMTLDELAAYVTQDVECEDALIMRLASFFPGLHRKNFELT